MNNVGKTALLEAIYLHTQHDANAVFQVNQLRGISVPVSTAEEMCRWLFFDREGSGPAVTLGRNTQGEEESTKTWVLGREGPAARAIFEAEGFGLGNQAMTQPAPSPRPLLQLSPEGFVLANQAIGSTDSSVPALLVLSQVDGKRRSFSMSIFDVQRPSWRGHDTKQRSFFLGHGESSPEADLALFSELEAAGRQEKLLSSLRLLEPRLQHLSLLILGGQPGLYGNIGLTRLVPLTFMGEGIKRLLTVLLAIASTAGGVVLIDEIENGLHYSVQQKVWEAIAHAARQADVQVFATTHSWECIQAAHHAFQDSGPYELRYFRLDRIRDDIVVKSMDERMLTAIEKTDLEVR
jgi:hypothetical protein